MPSECVSFNPSVRNNTFSAGPQAPLISGLENKMPKEEGREGEKKAGLSICLSATLSCPVFFSCLVVVVIKVNEARRERKDRAKKVWPKKGDYLKLERYHVFVRELKISMILFLLFLIFFLLLFDFVVAFTFKIVEPKNASPQFFLCPDIKKEKKWQPSKFFSAFSFTVSIVINGPHSLEGFD